MIWLLLLLLLVPIAVLLWLAILFFRAPLGYEDAKGFHFGEPRSKGGTS